MARLLFVFALLAGCKGMGGFASGLGHVAGDVGKVAGAVGHVAGNVGRITGETLAHAAPVVAHATAVVAVHALPVAENALEIAALAGNADQPLFEPSPTHSLQDGPLIDDDHDPCNACPDDLDCVSCMGWHNVSCVLTPPDSHARCESQQ